MVAAAGVIPEEDSIPDVLDASDPLGDTSDRPGDAGDEFTAERPARRGLPSELSDPPEWPPNAPNAKTTRSNKPTIAAPTPRARRRQYTDGCAEPQDSLTPAK